MRQGAVGERTAADRQGRQAPPGTRPQSGVGGRACGPGQPGLQRVPLTLTAPTTLGEALRLGDPCGPGGDRGGRCPDYVERRPGNIRRDLRPGEKAL